MDQIKIGNFLKSLRKEKELTQEQTAEIFGVSRRTVTRWETGTNMPDLDVLVEIADYYDVDLREIFDGERKNERMDKNLEETVKQVAEYSNFEKDKIKKVVQIYLIAGILAIIANLLLEFFGGRETFLEGFLKGSTIGLALCSMIFAFLYVTGKLSKVAAFKKSLFKKQN